MDFFSCFIMRSFLLYIFSFILGSYSCAKAQQIDTDSLLVLNKIDFSSVKERYHGSHASHYSAAASTTRTLTKNDSIIRNLLVIEDSIENRIKEQIRNDFKNAGIEVSNVALCPADCRFLENNEQGGVFVNFGVRFVNCGIKYHFDYVNDLWYVSKNDASQSYRFNDARVKNILEKARKEYWLEVFKAREEAHSKIENY